MDTATDTDLDLGERIKLLAKAARRYFYLDHRLPTRDEKGEAFWRTKDGTSQWIANIVHEAHDELLPDDYKYAFVVDALDNIADGATPDETRAEADVYTSDLLAWFGSHLSRPGYVDEARESFGAEAFKSVIDEVMAGQIAEKEEVFHVVWAKLEAQVDAT